MCAAVSWLIVSMESTAVTMCAAPPATVCMELLISAICTLISSTMRMMFSNCAPTSWMARAPSCTSTVPACMAVTACSVSCWTLVMRSLICSAASRDCSASLRTSSATTAKPRPVSPARAASMAALRARRLVCSAMAEMVSTISPICLELSPSFSWPRS